MNQNIYTHLTAIERDKPSFPLNYLRERNMIQGRVLDYGCGLGTDVNFLKSKGVNVVGFDPHYFPETPSEKFDTILCFYVLNILFKEEQNEVLMNISSLLKPSGKAYFAVRRDIKKDGFRTHFVHKKPTYQCQVYLPFKSIFKNENTEFYEYQPYNQLIHNQSKCPFCKPKSSFKLLAESRYSYAIYSPMPKSEGHTLILSKRHAEHLLNLTSDEQNDMHQLAGFAKSILEREFPHFSGKVEETINEVKNQRVNHAKIHLQAIK